MNRHHTDSFSPVLAEQGRFAHAWMLGLYRVLGEVMRRHPDVLFEGCASGGNRFDLGVLCYFPQIWLSDDTDAWERARIQTGASLGYPQNSMGCHVSATPNHQTMRTTPLETRFNLAAFGAFGYEMDLTRLSDAAAQCIQAQIAFYRGHRALFQRGALYRIESPFEGDECAWIVVSDDRRHALLLELVGLARPNSAQPPLRLVGLDPDLRYRVEARPQLIESAYFGEMLHRAMPELECPPEFLPCERESFTACGDLLMYAGIRRLQRLGGIGNTDDARPMTDFSSRLYLLDAVD